MLKEYTILLSKRINPGANAIVSVYIVYDGIVKNNTDCMKSIGIFKRGNIRVQILAPVSIADELNGASVARSFYEYMQSEGEV